MQDHPHGDDIGGGQRTGKEIAADRGDPFAQPGLLDPVEQNGAGGDVMNKTDDLASSTEKKKNCY